MMYIILFEGLTLHKGVRGTWFTNKKRNFTMPFVAFSFIDALGSSEKIQAKSINNDLRGKYMIDPAQCGLDQEDEKLLNQAIEAAKKAYSPYSGYHVGAALLTKDGNIYTGCNVENDSYGLGICSERNAITTAVSGDGKTMRIKKLAVIVLDPDGNIVSDGSPCGACRQFMAQFGLDADIIYHYGPSFKKVKVHNLLADPFIIKKAD